MKKVTAFIGSSRKEATYTAVREFERNLRSLAEAAEGIDFEIIFLSDIYIKGGSKVG